MRKASVADQYEARYRLEERAREVFEHGGVSLPYGEWVDVTPEQAAHLQATADHAVTVRKKKPDAEEDRNVG